MAINGITKKEFYREDYIGEYVIKRIVIRNGKRIQEREWVDNALDICTENRRAICIAPSTIITDTLYKQIENHNGGNLGKFKMHMYGIDSVYNKMTPDFMIAKDTKVLEEMIKTEFNKSTIVYTSGSLCVKYPKQFYLIPHNLSMPTEALALWLACFDGHKEVYLVGYDDLQNNKGIVDKIAEIIALYDRIKFIHVTNHSSPHAWKLNINFSSINRRHFISECDI